MDVDGMFYDGKWDGDVGVGHVDILDLFHDYCQIYFANSLGACSVEWSKRMVSWCAMKGSVSLFQHFFFI